MLHQVDGCRVGCLGWGKEWLHFVWVMQWSAWFARTSRYMIQIDSAVLRKITSLQQEMTESHWLKWTKQGEEAFVIYELLCLLMFLVASVQEFRGPRQREFLLSVKITMWLQSLPFWERPVSPDMVCSGFLISASTLSDSRMCNCARLCQVRAKSLWTIEEKGLNSQPRCCSKGGNVRLWTFIWASC